MASRASSSSGSGIDPFFWAIIVLLLVMMLSPETLDRFGGGDEPASDTGVSAPSWPGVDAEWSIEQVEALPVEAPKGSGYDRAAFGTAWADVDRNGCDTRNDILRRDLQDAKLDADGCTVVSGVMTGPYTGKTIEFVRDKSGGGVDVDHVRSLSDAWGAGAHAWTDERRLQYANDPMVLVAVDASENRSKGDKGPSEWMPRGRDAQCAYGAQYVAISTKYQLSVSRADAQALLALAKVCA